MKQEFPHHHVPSPSAVHFYSLMDQNLPILLVALAIRFADFKEFNITAKSLALIDISKWAPVLQLFVFFIILDFVQWFKHVLLHRYGFLWKFHKVHHSVKEMGFAAHLRYHWMENIFYKPLKTFGVMIIGGFEPEQAYIIHFITIAIGHFNHSNIKITWGPLKYIFNNPVMHLYHHASVLPEGKHGVNYGISLSLWDYIFKTNYIGIPELGIRFSDDFVKNIIRYFKFFIF